MAATPLGSRPDGETVSVSQTASGLPAVDSSSLHGGDGFGTARGDGGVQGRGTLNIKVDRAQGIASNDCLVGGCELGRIGTANSQIRTLSAAEADQHLFVQRPAPAVICVLRVAAWSSVDRPPHAGVHGSPALGEDKSEHHMTAWIARRGLKPRDGREGEIDVGRKPGARAYKRASRCGHTGGLGSSGIAPTASDDDHDPDECGEKQRDRDSSPLSVPARTHGHFGLTRRFVKNGRLLWDVGL